MRRVGWKLWELGVEIGMGERGTERLGMVEVARAAEILRAGGTVAFPTETVYGLGANALSASAVEGIFVAKERPAWDPLIVHVCDEAMLGRVLAAGAVGRVERELMRRFWPGPLTLLLRRGAGVPDAVTAGRRLVGVRMPRHPVALELIRAAGVPVAAPSANRFGRTSPTTAGHVLEDLDGRIDAVLDGGACAVGVESTVVEVVGDGVVVYRPGGVGVGELEELNDVGWVRMYEAPAARKAVESLPSPGVGWRHYAPRARLVLVGGIKEDALSRSGRPLELSLVDVVDEACGKGRVGVMLPEDWDRGAAEVVFRWGPWAYGEELARRLFAGLRWLDEAGAEVIVCPVPEMGGIGEALRDRLRKAAMKQG